MASIINASTTSTSGLVYSADASGVLQLQSNGTTGLTVDTAANVSTANLSVTGTLTVAGNVIAKSFSTVQTTTSGTSKDFTGIPSWAKKVTFMYYNCQTNGTSNPIIQLGTSGGVVTSGYISSGAATNGGAGSSAQYTNGFGLGGGVAATSIWSGIMTIMNISGNTWVASTSGAYNDASYVSAGGGYVTLSGPLTSIRYTTVGGTSTLTAGNTNIMYE
jgi:hypothetical protein